MPAPGSRARALGTLTVTAAQPAAFGPGARGAARALATVAALLLGSADDTCSLREVRRLWRG